MQTAEPYFPSNSLNLNAMFYRTSTKKTKEKNKNRPIYTPSTFNPQKKKEKKETKMELNEKKHSRTRYFGRRNRARERGGSAGAESEEDAR